MLYMFDLDDTLIKSYLSAGSKLQPYEVVEFLPGRLERLYGLARTDPHASFAIITNQAGVAFGYNTVDDITAKLAKVVSGVGFFWTRPFSVHCCFTHPEAPRELNGAPNIYFDENDVRRKPGCGMLREAMKSHRLVDAAAAVYIGDLDVDREAATAARVAYIHPDSFF